MLKAMLAAITLTTGLAFAQVDQARLMETLRSLPSPRSGLGADVNRENLARTAELIAASLKEIGYEVEEQKFDWPARPRFWRPKPRPTADAQQPVDAKTPAEEEEKFPIVAASNIIVEIKGGALASEVILIGAHYDAFEEAAGADDNGTGVAALLELARVLHGAEFDRTVRLVFFTLEENGLVGSRHYVTRWKKADEARAPEAREKIVGMVSLEMLGYYSDEPNSQKSPIPAIKDVFEPPTVGNFIAIAGIKKHQEFSRELGALMTRAQTQVPVMYADMFPIAPPDMLRSDHAPFLLAGVPAVMLTDTANFRNANYHKATDTVETIDAVRFTKVVVALEEAARGLAKKE